MRAYGYVRISRDEDGKKESIDTQRRLVIDFAKDHGMELSDVFDDNNISGYTFEREGLSRLKQLIEAGKVDVLFAKDLSRIGRHNAKVLLFLDYLDDHGVRLMLKSDNYDSKSDDDTLMGIKAWYNEMYLKDISRKITANIRQKQKDGLVIVEHFGYIKDPANKNKLLIDEEAAHTVRHIFSMYLEGLGTTKIARRLNEMGIKTPSMHKHDTQGFGWKPSWKNKDLWFATSIKRILTNDAYIGTLRCGIVRLAKMKGKKVPVPKEEQITHEKFMPPIVSKEQFESVQKIMKKRGENRVKSGNVKVHRYAGLLLCADCGKGFVARIRRNATLPDRIAYNCSTYYRYGKGHCAPHSINEEDIDKAVFGKLREILAFGKLNMDHIFRKLDENQSEDGGATELENLKKAMQVKREELKDYSRQLARHLISDDFFEELSREANGELRGMEERVSALEHSISNPEKVKLDVADTMEMLNTILSQDTITNADMTLLIDRIEVKETENRGKYLMPAIALTIYWNIPAVAMVDGMCA